MTRTKLLQIIRSILNSRQARFAGTLAYAALSLWLPSHFSITTCNSSLVSCMIEEFTIFWQLNRVAAIGNVIWRAIEGESSLAEPSSHALQEVAVLANSSAAAM